MIHRRTLLKGVSAGAGAVLLSPILREAAVQAAGGAVRPLRVVFVLFDNGFHESGIQPAEAPLAADARRDLSLAGLTLPEDIAPFAPFQERTTLIQGLSGTHLAPNHGAGFGALAGMVSEVGNNKRVRPAAESIDAAIARAIPGIFPLVALGVDPGNPATSTVYASSAWSATKPIATQCRPELAYESLFGSVGADRNDFAIRRNLLDFVAGDVRRVRSQMAGPEREQLDVHLDAIESLSLRQQRLSELRADGSLARHAPRLPASPAELMPDVLRAHFDVAAAALVCKLTNVVTISSGLCRINGSYRGFQNVGVHGAGHNERSASGVAGSDVLSSIRRFIAERTVELMQQLEATREGDGTMLDNTLVVFTSDSANDQHSGGANWPFLLAGNLGGGLRTGRLLSYPMTVHGRAGEWKYHGAAPPDNPKINALYCTLLHAVGAPRDAFNPPAVAKVQPSQYGPLPELLAHG